MDGCVYRTKDGECDLYSEGGKFKAFCDPEHCDNIAPTNGDRIRSMADEELAQFLYEYGGSSPNCDRAYLVHDYKSCEECWLDWLKEATE